MLQKCNNSNKNAVVAQIQLNLLLKIINSSRYVYRMGIYQFRPRFKTQARPQAKTNTLVGKELNTTKQLLSMVLKPTKKFKFKQP